MSLDTIATDLVPAHNREAVKTYIVWDEFNRMVTHYSTLAAAPHGAKALRTDYRYDGNSNRVQKTKESLSAWDSAWEITS
jgi:hypothetical protein